MKPIVRLPQQSGNRIKDPRKYICQVLDTFVRSYDVQHPQAARLLGNLLSGSFGSAVKLAGEIGSQMYANPWEHQLSNQLANFVKKLPVKDASLNPEQAAWDKFQAAEHRCHRTNQRLRAEKRVGRERYASLRAYAREYILNVIGHQPDMKRIAEFCDFGPGASVGIHGLATHRAAKLEDEAWTVTPTALPYAKTVMGGEPLIWELLQQRNIFCLDWKVFNAQFLDKTVCIGANKIIMVPKTATVHRTIAIEPLLNGFLQKGVDLFLRGRLRRFGLDLSDQESNALLARQGSLGGFNPFCTIDLASASDSVSIGVVLDLFPPDWFELLNNLRSPAYESEWGSGRYEKFVSMGNGFCFPVETLIFASLAHAVGRITGDIEFRVYGDDIIVRQQSALLLIELLKFYGFQVNRDKTFLFGPFRESCGADYFGGVPVRPYTLDFLPKTDGDIYKIHNGMLERYPECHQDVLDVILAPIPVKERFYRPIDGPAIGAATVSMDVFMGTHSAIWNRNLQSWQWHELIEQGVPDLRRPSPATEMYGVLHGNRPLKRSPGRVEFTLRRQTKVRVGIAPGAGASSAPAFPLYGRRHPFTNIEWMLTTRQSKHR